MYTSQDTQKDFLKVFLLLVFDAYKCNPYNYIYSTINHQCKNLLYLLLNNVIFDIRFLKHVPLKVHINLLSKIMIIYLY